MTKTIDDILQALQRSVCDPVVRIGFLPFFTSSVKKCGKRLDMAEQDVITPLAPGGNAPAVSRETGRLVRQVEMPG
jgi:hypothetical protein